MLIGPFALGAVFLPITAFKIAELATVDPTVQRGSVENSQERTRLYRVVVFIGRWSMLDVFVDAFTVALVQLHL